MNTRAGLLIFMTVCLCVPLYSGGGGEAASGLVPIKVMIIDNNRTPPEEGSLTDNRWTRWVQSEMAQRGVAVDFAPRGGSLVNHTIMMATGMAPDVAFTHGRLLFTKLAVDGGLTELGQLIAEYGPNVTNVLGDQTLQYGMIDGKQYAVPSRREDIARYISFIRKDWLDNLGLDPPSTKSELVDVLKAFRDLDPGNVGPERIVPWGYVTDDPGTVFESDFKLFDVMYSFVEHDQELNMSSLWPLRDGFKEFLRWMNELYHDDLLETEFATDTFEIKDRKIVNGRVGFFHSYWNHPFGQDPAGLLINLQKNMPGAEIIPVEVFENRDGNYPKLLSFPTRLYAFIPTRSKAPEAAMTYLNWLVDSEVGYTLTFGEEGDQYVTENELPVIKSAEYSRITFGYIAPYLRILGDYPVPQNARKAYNNQMRIADFNGLDDRSQQMAMKEGFTEPLFQRTMPAMMKHGPGLIKTCEKYWVKMIVEDDFEAEFAEFIDKLKSQRIEEIAGEREEYARMYGVQ